MKTISSITPSLCLLVLASAIGAPASAQDASSDENAPVGLLESPAMPRIYWGQTSRFTNSFNPAIGMAFDAALVHMDSDDEEGFDAQLKLAEITMQGPLSPNWWGGFALETNSEEVALTESALYYTGLGDRSALRAGKFFVDFGKQMQIHVHDLDVPDRPAVLKEYLGFELPGTGIQYDHWSPIGDDTAFRFSVGLFSEMAAHDHGDHGGHGEHGHEEEEEDEHGGVEMHMEGEYRDLSDMIMTARATAMTDVGANGVFQIGASIKTIPDFAFEGEGENDLAEEVEFEAEGLDQSVTGFDLTYEWNSDDGMSGWTFGGELLRVSGDIAGEIVDDETANVDLEIFNGDVQGWYAFAQHDMDDSNSFGVMISTFEHLEEETPEDTETSIYWNHYPTEYTRLRVAAVNRESDEEEDSQALVFGLSGWFGAHGHPYNW